MKQRRWLWLVVPLVGILAIGGIYLGGFGHADTTQLAGKAVKGADPLPIRQVVIFNSGVGYFQREGEVDGNARVDLSFPVGDINDLLKSLVLQDAKGRIGTVNYDSSDPIEKILRSFALDLTGNPTFGQILNQARGEKVEISRSEKKEGQITKVAGTIIGLEVQRRPITREQIVEVEVLNLNTATGLQAIAMEHIVSVRFQNPVLESEFQRALQVLAHSHDTQKKSVSVGFNGEGKRSVRVGYVVERPIWKTSYRLRMEPDGKVFLQGWALVDNTSDDDWNDVRMVLVSGKPISFKMNLYDPIYIPRPFVEPEMFASLRPPVYSGAIEEVHKQLAQKGEPAKKMPAPAERADQKSEKRKEAGYDKDQFRDPRKPQDMADAIKKMEEAKEVGKVIAGFNFKEGIQSVATANEIGDYFQYVIDQKISLPRQKSAMLPILDQTIEGQKFSIYNEAIHARYPLLGLKLKNTSGQPLTQGPITVYDGGVFGGDTRILDLQPKEERLLSYALDQGTEVKTDVKESPSPDLYFKLGFDTLSARYSVRQTRTYTIKNRSPHDRKVLLEHPIRAGWKLTDPKSPAETTRDLYRFQVAVAAGKTVAYDVAEEMPRVEDFANRTSYAVANGIEVKTVTEVDFLKVTGVKILKGLVKPSLKQRQTKGYFVQNLSDVDRTFTVDHIIRPQWVRLDDPNEPQKGPALFRFKLSIARGKTGQQTVREESSYDGAEVLLKNLSEETIRGYLANPAVSVDVKAAFTKALALQATIVQTQKQIAEVEKQLSVVTGDHNRVRENLKIIPMNSDYYKTFLEKFVAQDKQIESLQANVRDLNLTLQTQTRAYDQFLAKLDAE